MLKYDPLFGAAARRLANRDYQT